METRGERLLDLRRVLLLAATCARFGLFPFARYVPFLPFGKMSLAVRIRSAIEALGLTYLKLGQFLALRYDILPKEICDELNRLFESVRPMPFEEAKSIVESELGVPIGRRYADFCTTPIAAASIAQVHIAYTKEGKRVAVKVQRTGLEPIFKADIRNMRRLAAVIEKLGVFGRLSARGMIAQFEQWTLREMDFRIEGRTAERVQSESKDYVVIPRVYWNLTTRRVLTMDFIDGISVTAARELVDAKDRTALIRTLPDFDLPVALRNLAFASFAQLFTYGFFHGDPHPGNIFFMPGNRVAFLDFGIFGELNQQERQGVAAQIEALAVGDLETSFRYYSRQVAITDETDYLGFRRDCLEVLGRWYRALADPNSPIQDRHLAKYTGEMIDVSRRNGLRYDLNYLLFWRALNNLNGTLWRVDPTYDLVQSLREFFNQSRPSEMERVLGVVDDWSWQDSLVRCAKGIPDQLEHVFSLNSEDSRQLAVVQSRSRPLDRQLRAESRSSALAILGVALVLLLVARTGWILKAGATVTFLATLYAENGKRR
jgi:ubiquinone biosynthesis protein